MDVFLYFCKSFYRFCLNIFGKVQSLRILFQKYLINLFNPQFISLPISFMNTIQIKDKKFSLTIPETEILAAVRKVADAINHDIADKNPLFICVLNGAFMFASDLMKNVNIPCEITFIKLSSYDGLYTTGAVKEIIGLNESVVGRNVVVVEDIVDTGITMERILSSLRAKGANEIRVATFLQKPDALQRDIQIDYIAMKIPNDFIVGYGLDYDGYGRNLKDIYTLVAE
jgi:hypoxanthine phosphoribosyltransferase